MKKKRLIILLSFLIPIFILTGLALWIVTTDHVITPAYDENHTLAQYFVEETNTSYDGNEKTPNFKDGVYTNDEDKENFLNTVDFYYKTKGTIGAYTEGLPTNAGTYSVKILEILDSNDNSDNQEGALYVTINISTVNPTLATAVSVSYAKQTDGTTRSNYFVTSQKTSDITYTGSFKGVDGNTLEGTINYSDTTYSSLQIGNDIEYSYTFTPSNSNYNTYSGKCKINTYATVKYFIYSTAAPSKLLEVVKNTTLSQESDPSRSGYVFQGWYTNSSYTTVMDFSVPVTTDTNIYAKWQEESFSISYNLDGGTVNGTNPTSYTYSSSTITLINPTKNGYDFLGWTGTGLSGKTMTVKINKGSSGDRTYTANWGIKLKLGVQSYNYVAGKENRQWYLFKTSLIPNLVKDSFQDVKGNKEPLTPNSDFTIVSMTDGVNSYDSSNTGSYLIGSTYLVKVQLTTTAAETYSLYDIETDSYGSVGSFILKYKTAIVNGSYYTIEDAILTTSGNITLAGDSAANLHVETTFTSLSEEQGNPYESQIEFDISSRTLLVPFANSLDYKTITNNSYNSNVYSALIIPHTITLNIKSSGILAIGAYLTNSVPNVSATNQRGVIKNDGIINLENGSNLYSYGYLKGAGTLNVYNGATATDVMRMYDWCGGSAASKLKDVAFPTNSWSLHNISCMAYYYGGSKLIGYVFVTMSKVNFEEEVVIIGKAGESKCMFMPTANTNDNYISKYSFNAANDSENTGLTDITGSNQIVGQKDRILLHGSYTDNTISLSISVLLTTVKMETNSNRALPIGFLDVELDKDSELSLNSSDYAFLPGTEVKINEGAVLTIGSDIDISFISSDQYSNENIDFGDKNRIFTSSSYSKDSNIDSYMINNGIVDISGSIGGTIISEKAGAVINLSSGAVSSKFTSLCSTNSPYYYTDYCYANGEIKDFSDDKFIVGCYSSIQDGSKYIWKQETNLKYIRFDFYDNDGTTLLGSKTKALIGSENSYTFVGSEFRASKTYYDFDKWRTSVNGEVADGNTYSNTGNSGTTVTHKLYASWTEHEYNFIYSVDYITSSDEEVTVDPNNVVYTNKIEYVTKSMLDAGSISLPTVSYTVDGKEKFFNGWFAGVDKSTGKTISTFTSAMLQKLVSDYGNEQDIYLYCEFTDVPYSKITYVPNHPTKTLSYPEGEVLPGDTIDHPDVNQFDNVITERYYFDGWYTQPNGQGDKYADDTIINNNITLYGNWIEKNSITYSTGTQLNIDLGLYSSFSSTTYYYIPGAAHSLLLDEEPSETGHKFVGWTISRRTDGWVDYENDASDISTSAFNSKSITLYASYTVEPYTITVSVSNATYVIKSNNIEIAMTNNSGTAEYGSEISVSVTPADGYASDGNTFSPSLINGKYMPASNLTITIKTKESCIVSGTLITLADGSKKPVDDITYEDEILVFNHEKGKWDVSRMLFITHEDEGFKEYETITLHFSNNYSITIVAEHGFYDMDLMRYVFINKNNIDSFIGHKFYSAELVNNELDIDYIELLSYEIKTEYTKIYCPVTAYHMNSFNNGLLAMPNFPYGAEGLVNIFEYDDDLKFNEEKMKADIEKYGIFEYEYFKDYFSYEAYLASPAVYLKVSIGKGYLTHEQMMLVIEYLLTGDLIE